MAVYHCEECDQWLDDDWHPMVEYKGRIMCDECEIAASADDEEESEMDKVKAVQSSYAEDMEELRDKVAQQNNQIAELQREFDILDGACDFWKQEAIDRGYEE